ncbi:F-box protein At5g52880 isoform X2 [Magnolia sinica]|uniref:F-box protein At5g52880 isoform X2 n=1 Tax=Magnolia sinica TaxID=86752 RepID=UPI00265A7D85|nr:F-box protein At5g52880 isoform X2 [Magnolia sinica]
MALSLERYEKLGLRESMCRVYDYTSACKELSFILRGAYSKVPKNLQSIMFQDTLTAFRLLPNVHTSRGVSAANLLLQAAEVALPKQKRGLAVTEFKHAVVAQKRHLKTQQAEGGSEQLPQDVLAHIFSFLDMRTLVAVGLVCWSWNSAASDNKLWQSQYALFFGKSDICCENEEQIGKLSEDQYQKKEDMDPVMHLDWRETFKRTYIGKSSWRSTSNRGYCCCCKSIIWLSNMKCTSLHHTDEKQQQKIKPVSPQQQSQTTVFLISTAVALWLELFLTIERQLA